MNSEQREIKGKHLLRNNISTLGNSINYAIKAKQAVNEIEKMLISYKDILKDYCKKYILLKTNFIKYFFDNSENFKFDKDIYPTINENVLFIKRIFDINIESFSKELKVLENIKLSLKNEEIRLEKMNKNKNKNLDTKKLEKSLSDCDNDYKKLIINFENLEEQSKKYFVKIRDEKKEFPKLKESLDQTVEETEKMEKNFLLKYSECDKSFIDFNNSLEGQLKEVENENNKIMTNLKNLVNEIVKLNLIKNEDTIKIKEEINKKMSNFKEGQSFPDFELFKKNNGFQTNYTKDKYKIISIHQLVTDDKIEYDKKKAVNQIGEELGFEKIMEETIVLREEDLYNIVELFYKHFHFIDRVEYNIILEKQKIDFKRLTNILLYPGLMKKRKEEFKDLHKINEEEAEKLYEGMSNKHFRLVFLQRLNNYRALGVLDMPEFEYNITSNCFKLIADNINKESDVNKKDKDSAKFLIIISQTFYVLRNKEKHYLQYDIVGHSLFNDADFWSLYTEHVLEDEAQKVKKVNPNAISKKMNDIVFATLTTIVTNMKSFQMNIENVKKICQNIFQKYEIREDIKNMIFSMVDSTSIKI